MTIEEVIDAHGSYVRNRVLKIVGPEAVDDVCQRVWIKVWRNLDSFRGESKITSWLFRIASNEAYTWHRNQRRQPEGRLLSLPLELDDEPIGEAFLHRGPDPERACLARCDYGRVSARVRRFGPKTTRLVALVSRGVTFEEAARISGMPVGTAKARIFRARTAMAALREECSTWR